MSKKFYKRKEYLFNREKIDSWVRKTYSANVVFYDTYRVLLPATKKRILYLYGYKNDIPITIKDFRKDYINLLIKIINKDYDICKMLIVDKNKYSKFIKKYFIWLA